MDDVITFGCFDMQGIPNSTADWSDSNLYAPKHENPMISIVHHFLDGKLLKSKYSNTILVCELLVINFVSATQESIKYGYKQS